MLVNDISAALLEQTITDELDEVALTLFVDIATYTINTHTQPVAFVPLAIFQPTSSIESARRFFV